MNHEKFLALKKRLKNFRENVAIYKKNAYVIYESPLSQDLEFAKQQQVAFENSLESEKANALQEMSRGKASAMQALKAELNLQHEKDKLEMTEQHAQELSEKLELSEREKQVSV